MTTRLLLGMAAFFAMAGSGAVWGADYYFDADVGDDQNAGTSPEAPWRTLEMANRFDFAPGDRVLFKKGCQWRGSLKLQSGDEKAPLLYSAYGEEGGAKPILSRSVSLADEKDWVADGDSLWVSRSDVTPFFCGTDVGNIILDGKAAAFKRWTREDLKNQNDFWFDLTGDRRIRFYSEKNPAHLYDSIEAAVMNHVVDHSNASFVTVDGLDVRNGAAHGFGGSNPNHLTIRNCDISWIGGGDQFRGGGEGRRVRFGNGIEFWSSARHCLVEKNRIWEVYDAGLTNQGTGKNVEENLVYRGNLIWNCEYSFEYWNREEESLTKNILFEKNLCYNAGFGWGHIQRPDKNGRCVMIYQNSARTENFVIRDNVFCDAVESLVRIDLCPTNPEWTKTGLRMDRNRYFNGEGRDYFLWFGKKYQKADFSVIQNEFGQERDAVLDRPEKSLDEWIAP